jgi:hypothetical protein
VHAERLCGVMVGVPGVPEGVQSAWREDAEDMCFARTVVRGELVRYGWRELAVSIGKLWNGGGDDKEWLHMDHRQL